jgi:hypothetical protein
VQAAVRVGGVDWFRGEEEQFVEFDVLQEQNRDFVSEELFVELPEPEGREFGEAVSVLLQLEDCDVEKRDAQNRVEEALRDLPDLRGEHPDQRVHLPHQLLQGAEEVLRADERD